jgi:hypothetical protein
VKRFTSLFLAASILMTTSTNAAVITVGNIITVDTTNYMENINTGRLYSRLDATIGRTYEQLTTVDILSGGNWEGWSIATSQVSDDLISALLGVSSPCSGAVENGSTCGNMTDGIRSVLGVDGGDRYWVYLSTFDTPSFDENDLGYVFLLSEGIYDYDDHISIEQLTEAQSSYEITNLSYLMYKDVVVTEPSTFAILALGFMGIAVRQFKK